MSGKYPPPPPPTGEVLSLTTIVGDMIENPHTFCELFGFGQHICGLGLHRHHVLAKGKLRGIPGGQTYCNRYPEIFYGDVCGVANISRLADTKKARALLLQARVDLWGQAYVEDVLDGLRAATKTGMPEWKLSALLVPLDHEE